MGRFEYMPVDSRWRGEYIESAGNLDPKRDLKQRGPLAKPAAFSLFVHSKHTLYIGMRKQLAPVPALGCFPLDPVNL